MAAQVELLFLPSSKEAWLSEVISQYQKKISRYVPFKVNSLKSKKFPREQKQLKIKAEEDTLLKAISPTDIVVVFDERGKSPKDSRAFAEFMGQQLESGSASVKFIIGGAYGLGPAVKKRANVSLSLTGLTLSHQVAMVVVLEQIYRTMTILKGIPYHND